MKAVGGVIGVEARAGPPKQAGVHVWSAAVRLHLHGWLAAATYTPAAVPCPSSCLQAAS